MPITQINDGNGLNAAGGKSIRDRSRFINKYPIGGTYQFGVYGVNFAAETVADDNHTIHLGHNVISNTLKAPLLQDVILKKDLFWVPDMCILPMNWEKFFVNPVKGEDVPNDVGCCVEHFGSQISRVFSALESHIAELRELEEPTSDELSALATNIFRYMLLAEMIFSDGSLPSALQCNLSGKLGKDFVFGQWFDGTLTSILGLVTSLDISFPNQTDPFTITNTTSASDIRTILYMMRDDFSFTVTPPVGSEIADFAGFEFLNIIDDDYPINLRRLWAYQIVCAHFYTNDKIDYVYSAELYRQLVYSSYQTFKNELDGNNEPLYFVVNGLNYQYDFLSASYFNFITSNFDAQNDAVAIPALQYFRLLFGYNLSLRYLDYFTGSRSQPLAVGDVTVAVNNNMVNVVNVAAKTMAAKMLNVANRIGQRIESYVKEFFGIEMAKDYHNPFWLAHTSDQIDNPENQNTGAAQYSQINSITSIFRTGGNSQGIEFHPDRAGVIIGITYFDIQRVYPRSVNRQFFHVDRYDDFLPYLQYVGDQEVSQMELDSVMEFASTPYGYQGRNMEYKQQVPYCFGGFAHDLAPYVFLANEKRPLRNLSGFPEVHVGPSYIRSLPTELDRFFNILNGYSLDTYYHFAIVNNIYWDASRPMAALPGILNG